MHVGIIKICSTDLINNTTKGMQTVFDFEVARASGDLLSLSDYRGKVLLVVNTASKCGFTPQYEGLEALYRKYKERGLVILGFPCDQFGHQEPGSMDEIKTFCQINYGVSFPILHKVEVNGAGAIPLYEWLKGQARGWFGRRVKWNFTKFLISRDGRRVKRFCPLTRPRSLERYIEALLAEQP